MEKKEIEKEKETIQSLTKQSTKFNRMLEDQRKSVERRFREYVSTFFLNP